MDRETAQQILVALEQALAGLDNAYVAIQKIADDDERKALSLALAQSVSEVMQKLRAPMVLQHPELEPKELGEPDDVVDEQDKAMVSRLALDDVERIDRCLLAECARSWRKVARVVGFAATALKDEYPELPLAYYVQRVASMARAGSLEAQGNLQYMRYSEVRLPGG